MKEDFSPTFNQFHNAGFPSWVSIQLMPQQHGPDEMKVSLHGREILVRQWVLVRAISYGFRVLGVKEMGIPQTVVSDMGEKAVSHALVYLRSSVNSCHDTEHRQCSR